MSDGEADPRRRPLVLGEISRELDRARCVVKYIYGDESITMNGMTAADVYYVARRWRAWVEEAVTQDLDHGIPLYVWVVVRDVVESPGSTVHEIQSRLGMPQSMVSKAVMRAAEQGWVERRRDPEDRRRVRVYPGSGVQRRLQGRLNRSWDDLLDTLFGGTLAPGDRAALSRSLALLHGRLKALEEGGAR